MLWRLSFLLLHRSSLSGCCKAFPVVTTLCWERQLCKCFLLWIVCVHETEMCYCVVALLLLTDFAEVSWENCWSFFLFVFLETCFQLSFFFTPSFWVYRFIHIICFVVIITVSKWVADISTVEISSVSFYNLSLYFNRSFVWNRFKWRRGFFLIGA